MSAADHSPTDRNPYGYSQSQDDRLPARAIVVGFVTGTLENFVIATCVAGVLLLMGCGPLALLSSLLGLSFETFSIVWLVVSWMAGTAMLLAVCLHLGWMQACRWRKRRAEWRSACVSSSYRKEC